MAGWPVQDAKARFSELLDTALNKGPQVVTRRGVEEAVLVPIGEWRRLQQTATPGIKEVLLGTAPQFADITPPRGRLHRRRPVSFR